MREAQILPFIKDFINLLCCGLEDLDPSYGLSATQKLWLGFCLTGILLTNSICWARYERMSFGGYLVGALSWMFRHTKLNWNALLKTSIRSILTKYGITQGDLAIDDTERERSKNARLIYKLGKTKDKKSGGYFNGQSIVFLLLVTQKVSVPVGFEFYQMDPALRAWRKKDERLRSKGVPKAHRPAAPERDAAYPTKNEIALGLVRSFRSNFKDIKVKSVNADALFGTGYFVDGVRELSPKSQGQSLILSLLFDHCLLSHPTQAARIKDNLPLYTVGSLRDRLSVESLISMFEYILKQPNPKEYLHKLTKDIDEVYTLRVSSKHMSGRKLSWWET